MNLNRLGTFASSVALVSVLTSCGETTVPVDGRFQATYIAESAGGMLMPAVLAATSEYTDVLLGDTLTFSLDGTVRVVTVFRRTTLKPTPLEETHKIDFSRPYSIDGENLIIGGEPCPPNAQCVGPDSGEIYREEILLRHMYWQNKTVRFYRAEFPSM